MADIREPTLSEFQYEGIYYPNLVLESSIRDMKNVEVREDDTWIVTFPKSGTHWMMEILGLIHADGYPDKVDRSLYVSCAEMINTDSTRPGEPCPHLDIISAGSSPRVILTHLQLHYLPPDMIKKAKVVYLARNPKDILVSWRKFSSNGPSEQLSMQRVISDLIAGRMQWGRWLPHLEPFWKLRDEENVLFLFYEDMLKDLKQHVKRISDHIGRPLSEESLQRVVHHSTLDAMKATYQQLRESGKGQLADGAGGKHTFLHKGQCGQWKTHFTVAQNEAFDEWYRKEMAHTDLTMTFH